MYLVDLLLLDEGAVYERTRKGEQDQVCVYVRAHLAPFDGMKRGVSRFHAAIECTPELLALVDLGSTNGTFLNGERLVDHEPQELSNGDEIRLGTLVMYCFFNLEG